MRYNGNNYLLTAGHVLEDTSSYDVYNGPVTFRSIALINSFRDVSNLQKFPMDRPMLSHLTTGPSSSHPYIIWKDLDLGLLYLGNDSEREFDATLINRGYEPIEISDIDTICKLNFGDNIKAIGFPGDLAFIGERDSSNHTPYWESRYISLPILSNGFISNFGLHKFTADIFIYGGNSGGPVLRNGKLIGLVSAFFRQPKKQGDLDYFERHTLLIKSSNFMSLIRALENKMAHQK